MKKNGEKLILLLAALFLTSGQNIFAAESYRINAGNTLKINEWGVCKLVTNNPGWPEVFIPTKTANEWTQFRNNKPSHVNLADCIPSNATITIWERTCGVVAYSYAVSSLPQSLTTCPSKANPKTYTFSIEGSYLRIHCYRAPDVLPANNIVAVRLTVPGYGNYWASSVAGYNLGSGGIAASAANALGPNTQVGPYYLYYGPYTYSDCTFLGNNHSDLWLGFSF